jgi:NADH:ubiquinone oxidoreductase subunit E
VSQTAGTETRGHGRGEGAELPRVFEGEGRRKLDALLAQYPAKAGALLPALWMVQEAHGWISPAGMAEVVEALDLTPAYVKGVVTFYTMYHQHPVGKYFIQVCTTSPCMACGAEHVVEAFLKHTGCGELGTTSADGRWTIVEVECLGACGFPTPVMINNDFVESVTAASVPALVARYR